MPVTLNANSSTGFIATSDTSSILQLQTGGTTAVTVDASQNVTLAGTLTATGVTTVPAGTAAAPAITTTGDTNTGIFFPAADTIAFSEGGAEAMRINSSGNVGIGTTSPGTVLNVVGTAGIRVRGANSASNGALDLQANNTSCIINSNTFGAPVPLVFQNSGTEQMRLDSAGNMGLGVTPSAWALSGAPALQIKNAAFVGYLNNAYLSANQYFTVSGNSAYIANGFATVYTQKTGEHQWSVAASGTAGNTISFTQAMTLDASGNVGVGVTNPSQRLDLQNGSSDVSIRFRSPTNSGYISYGTDNSLQFLTSSNERARITSGGDLLVGKNVANDGIAGVQMYGGANAGIVSMVYAGRPLYINRLSTDGDLIEFAQANTTEGSISVSGTTVSYNGGHLSRYAQTQGAKDESLVKGTVLSNLDEMNVYVAPTTYWTEEDELPEGVSVGNVKVETHSVNNEQLNKVKVSDVEGDANVAGVFVNWSHDEAHDVDEINMAMTGDMIIRIAQGTTVQRGDLLMSAGNGTAKPQGDDIVRSKTVAKVTSTHITCTYADGSYCVPCVLMAC